MAALGREMARLLLGFNARRRGRVSATQGVVGLKITAMG